MALEKRPFKDLLNKMVVTKEGKRLGIIKDVTFETRTGELIHIIVTEPTAYAMSLGLERSKDREMLVPYNSIIAVGDFVVVSEEDFA